MPSVNTGRMNRVQRLLRVTDDRLGEAVTQVGAGDGAHAPAPAASVESSVPRALA